MPRGVPQAGKLHIHGGRQCGVTVRGDNDGWEVGNRRAIKAVEWGRGKAGQGGGAFLIDAAKAIAQPQ